MFLRPPTPSGVSARPADDEEKEKAKLTHVWPAPCRLSVHWPPALDVAVRSPSYRRRVANDEPLSRLLLLPLLSRLHLPGSFIIVTVIAAGADTKWAQINDAAAPTTARWRDYRRPQTHLTASAVMTTTFPLLLSVVVVVVVVKAGSGRLVFHLDVIIIIVALPLLLSGFCSMGAADEQIC